MVDLIGIEPMTSSMPWKRAPSCATGPHAAGMQLFYCLRSGWIRQSPRRSTNFSRLPRGRTLSRIPFPIRHSMAPFEAARLRPNQKNFRDWEHLQGGPVSKTIESVGQMVQQAIARFPRTP